VGTTAGYDKPNPLSSRLAQAPQRAIKRPSAGPWGGGGSNAGNSTRSSFGAAS
jgi:hypothetical protein